MAQEKPTETASQDDPANPQQNVAAQQLNSELAKARVCGHPAARHPTIDEYSSDCFCRLSRSSPGRYMYLCFRVHVPTHPRHPHQWWGSQDPHVLTTRLSRGEQTATALESKLDDIESRIEQLLASVEQNAAQQGASRTQSDPNPSSDVSKK